MNYNLQKGLTVFFISASLLLGITGNSRGQVITTYAGTGAASYGGDNGQATNAQLDGPNGLAEDTAGSIYVADVFNNAIRKITKAGIITTIAGGGLPGFSGDGNQATSAQFTTPTGVAVDIAGNIYIADNGNNRIRKVDISTGIITTIAGTGSSGYAGDGGPATNAKLHSPDNLIVDASGTVFFSDFYNNRVRKISGGTISTVAGNGNSGFAGDGGAATSAEIAGPEGLAEDASGNIYFAEYGNNRVRKVTVSTGFISTVAGNGSGTYGGDGGQATSAQLQNPTGVAIDKIGNIIIADFSNNVIRKVTVTTGVISTIAGNDSQGFSGDNGPATDAQLFHPNDLKTDTAGNIYVADLNNNRVRKIGGCSLPVSVDPQDPTTCAGADIVLIATGGTTYNWTPSAGLSDSTGDTVVANITVNTTYTVTATTKACQGINTIAISVIPTPNKPTITISVTGDTLISSATQGNQWYFNDTLIAGATDQQLIITGHRFGYYYVTTINPANGCSSTSDSTNATGINDIAIRNSVSIYPNPTNNIINLQINSSAGSVNEWSLQLTDVLGRMLYSRSSLKNSNTIDISAYDNGVYFISVTNKTGSAVFPIVRQN